MFRKTILLAALALPLAAGFVAAPAWAEGEQASTPKADIEATLGAAQPGGTMAGRSVAPVVIAGMERLVVEPRGETTQNYAQGGAPRVTTDGDGTYHTTYGR